MLPSPPHWATSRPPGRSAACRRANSRSWSAIQWNVAVERTASTGSLQLELEQVGDAHVDVGAEPLAGGGDHRGRLVDRDHPPARQPLDQRLGDAARPAAGVEHALVAVELQPVEHGEPERLHRAGDAVVAASVPFAYWHTIVRYHVPDARTASSASTRESCPPCQAIGERMVPATPASSTTSSAPRIARA